MCNIWCLQALAGTSWPGKGQASSVMGQDTATTWEESHSGYVFGLGSRECRCEISPSPGWRTRSRFCGVSFAGISGFEGLAWNLCCSGATMVWELVLGLGRKEMAGGRSLEALGVLLFGRERLDTDWGWAWPLSGGTVESLKEVAGGGTGAVCFGVRRALDIFGGEAWFGLQLWLLTASLACPSCAFTCEAFHFRPAASFAFSLTVSFLMECAFAGELSPFRCVFKVLGSRLLSVPELRAALSSSWPTCSGWSWGGGGSLRATVGDAFASFPWLRSAEWGRWLEGCSTWGYRGNITCQQIRKRKNGNLTGLCFKINFCVQNLWAEGKGANISHACARTPKE